MLTAAQTRAVRMRANGLTGAGAADVVRAVHRVVGVQAQDTRAARLQMRARTAAVTQAEVDAAVAGRSLVRTWAMRGTLHAVVAEDVRWIVGLLGPRFAARSAGRRRQLGLDDAACAKGMAALQDVLGAEGPTVRADLVAALDEHGVRLDPKSQAPAHLVSYAAMQGLLCRGPDDGDEPTYVLLDDWVEAAAPLPDADASRAVRFQTAPAARLAARYLVGFGPATAADFAAWAGLPLGVARRAFASLEDELVPVTVAGETAYRLADEPEPEEAAPSVRLLGHFDTYLLGYRSRSLTVPAEFDGLIQAGGGFIMPTVLADGRAIGTWRQRRHSGGVQVIVQPFTTLSQRLMPALRAEAADLGRFLGVDTELQVSPPPGR